MSVDAAYQHLHFTGAYVLWASYDCALHAAPQMWLYGLSIATSTFPGLQCAMKPLVHLSGRHNWLINDWIKIPALGANVHRSTFLPEPVDDPPPLSSHQPLSKTRLRFPNVSYISCKPQATILSVCNECYSRERKYCPKASACSEFHESHCYPSLTYTNLKP